MSKDQEEHIVELKRVVRVLENHPEIMLEGEESIDYDPVEIDGVVVEQIPVAYSIGVTMSLGWTDYCEEDSPAMVALKSMQPDFCFGCGEPYDGSGGACALCTHARSGV